VWGVDEARGPEAPGIGQVGTPHTLTRGLGALTVPALTLGAMCLAAAVKHWWMQP